MCFATAASTFSISNRHPTFIKVVRTFQICCSPTTCTFSTDELLKEFRKTPVLWHFFTSKYASRHKEPLVNISASKKKSGAQVFRHFLLPNVLGAQRALFQHLSFLKRTGARCFDTFYFHLLPATDTLQFLWNGSKFALRHITLHFFWP